MLGEWYQKTHKTEDTNKLTLFVSSAVVGLPPYGGNPTTSDSCSVLDA
jgi:hypothetical protein